MHILLAILSALGVIAFFLIRANQASQAAQELGESAGGVLGYFRRMMFRRKATQHPLTLIEDPREAVASLLVALAKDKGDLAERQLSELETMLSKRLEIQHAKDVLALARWNVKDNSDSGSVWQRVAKLLTSACTEEQKQDVLNMCEEIAHLPDDRMTDIQAHTIEQMKYRFGNLKP